jgi:Uma2 family endonuclease
MTAVPEMAFDTDRDYEIVDGQWEEKMAGARHGRTIMRLGARLQLFVEEHSLGDLYSPDTTFQIGQNERLADLAFVSAARIPADGVPEGKWEFAPDLAVEVVSPNDFWQKVNRKVHEYFAAGVRQVWLVSTDEREVSIYDSPTQITVLTENDELSSEALLPGFRCRVSDIFGKTEQPAQA